MDSPGSWLWVWLLLWNALDVVALRDLDESVLEMLEYTNDQIAKCHAGAYGGKNSKGEPIRPNDPGVFDQEVER